MYDSRVSTLDRPADATTGEALAFPDSATSAAGDPATSRDDVSIDDLADQLRTFAAHLAAATAQWLDLVAVFCRRDGHLGWGLASPAHWLAWQCSLSPGTAREYVRVASALQDLPVIRAHFTAGRISYSKVRAITCIADPDNERTLVRLALNGTAAQVEKAIAAWIGAINRDGPDRETTRYQRRGVTPGPFDNDGCGAADPPEWATLSQRRADAFMALIDDRTGTRHGADRIRASLDIGLRVLTHNADGTCHVRNGPALSVETARRLTCDAELELFHPPTPTLATPSSAGAGTPGCACGSHGHHRDRSDATGAEAGTIQLMEADHIPDAVAAALATTIPEPIPVPEEGRVTRTINRATHAPSPAATRAAADSRAARTRGSPRSTCPTCM